MNYDDDQPDDDGHIYSAVIAGLCILCAFATIALIVAFT